MRTNWGRFAEIYAAELRREYTAHPEQYEWPVEMLDSVVERMAEALARGSAHTKSNALARTARALGIKNTIKGWRDYLNAEQGVTLTHAQLLAVCRLWDSTNSEDGESFDVEAIVAARDAMGAAFPSGHVIYSVERSGT